MNSAYSVDNKEFININNGLIFTAGLAVIFAAAIYKFGLIGLLGSIALALGTVLVPYIYNKPQIFLIFSLFIFPFTRLFSLEDKFVITATLYTASIPCFIWLYKKHFSKITVNSAYMFWLIAYTVIIFLNIFRIDSGLIEVAKEFGRTYFALFICFSVYDLISNSTDRFNKMVKAMGYMFNAVALIAIAQYATKTGSFVVEGLFRSRGVFFNFNEYAYVISIFTCFAMYFLLSSKTHKNRIFWGATILLNLVALLTTLSKTSLFTTMLVLVVMSAFISLRQKIWLFSTYAVLGGLLSAYIMLSGMADVLIQRFGNTTSLEWRFEMWRNLQNMILQGNWLLGEGANASRKFLLMVVPFGETAAPHNIYLETTYNYGLIAAIPFVLIFLALIHKGITMFSSKHSANNQHKIIGIGIITITVITLIQNFVSNAFYDRAVNVIFWAIITILICRYNQLAGKEAGNSCTFKE